MSDYDLHGTHVLRIVVLNEYINKDSKILIMC